MNDTRAAPVAALASFGVLLLANPLYVDGVLVRTSGFRLDGLIYAAVTTLGFLALLSAVAIGTELAERESLAVTAIAIALAAVAGFLAYTALVTPALMSPDSRILGYGHRKTLIASAVATTFLASAALAARRPRALLGAPVVFGIGLAFATLGPGSTRPLSSSLTEPIALAVLTSVVFPGSGTLLYVAAVVLGVLLVRWRRDPTTESGRPAR